MASRTMCLLVTAMAAANLIAAPARAATTHQLEIDGSPLFSRYYVIVGTTDWLDARQIRTVSLEQDRTYQLRASAGVSSTFWVDANGNVGYPATAETFLDGAGTGRLTLAGVQVTIDARYLSGTGVLISDVPPHSDDFTQLRTVRLLPSPTYRWQQGGGVIVRFTAALNADGRWSYDPQFDISQGGYIAGGGTSTLTFYGLPLIVDARAAGGTGLLMHHIWGLAFTTSAVQTVLVLPTHVFRLQIRGGEMTTATFAMDNSGDLTYDPSLPFTVDQFHGMTRLTVTGPL